MKLEVGMYVRTKWGYICKLININDFREPSMKYGVEASYLKDIMFIGDDDILKASHNIIDLIEVGDIVTTKHLGLEKEYIEVINNETSLEILKSYFKEKSLELISVVTKQQFESMKYEVK